MFKSLFFLTLLIATNSYSLSSEVEIKKTHLEDIFIWKMSDELKLTVQEERKFTDINKQLNRKKSEINRKIQSSIQNLSLNGTEESLNAHKKLIQEYNNISVAEFESIKKLLGTRKFIDYLKIKNDLTTKVKSILIGDKNPDKDERKAKLLPPPKVIFETK